MFFYFSINYSLAEPIEYIPRSKGLGLGAESRPPYDEKNRGRKRKPGDPSSKIVCRLNKEHCSFVAVSCCRWCHSYCYFLSHDNYGADQRYAAQNICVKHACVSNMDASASLTHTYTLG